MKADGESVLRDCLRLVLKPIVKFCVRRSIKLQDFLEASKQVFLEVAAQEMKESGEDVNASRLSVVTGLHRRDVTRLTQTQEERRYGTDLLSRVIGQWQNDKRFSTKKGEARVLEFEGKQSEFAKLVQSVTKNINPYTVLFELERVHAVEKTARGLKLVHGVYVPSGDAREGFSMFSEDIDDFLHAVEQNVASEDKDLHLHIRTRYDNICPDFMGTIKQWFLERGEILHQEARRFLSQFDKDINPDLKGRPGGGRAVIGTFSFTEIDKSAVNTRKKGDRKE